MTNDQKIIEMRHRTIIDLYAGVGGLSLGATRAGFELSLAVELDKNAITSHKLNFPNSPHLQEDILQLDGHKLLKEAGLKQGELDGLIGGPPCQGFSLMGHKKIEDHRNDLFIKFFKLVSECRPKFFVAENVLGILASQYEPIHQAAKSALGNGYVTLPPIKLKASDYGASTIRERVFFIGYLPDYVSTLSPDDFLSKRTGKSVNVKCALAGLPAIRDEWISEDQSWRRVKIPKDSELFELYWGKIPEGVGDATSIQLLHERQLVSGCFGTRHSNTVRNRYDKLKPGECDHISKSVRLSIKGLCPTLRAGTGPENGSFQAVRPIHPTSPRVITPREAARLQGFPDWFRFSSTKWQSFRQIGNSVCPIVSEAVLRVIHTKIIA